MAKLERTEKPINVILEECKRGEISLPEIQRGYVWNQSQVRDLVESLYKEYPCGLILYWKPPAEVLENLKLKDFAVPVGDASPASRPSFLVLDGQQRITSLIKVLKEDPDVRFHVGDEKFEIYSGKMSVDPLWVPAAKVIEEGAPKVWMELKSQAGNHYPEEYWHSWLARLGRLEKIKDYRIPVEILHSDDFEEVTEAFIRINSRGTKLREAELAIARLAFSLPGIVSEEFDSALEEYEKNGFEFDARLIIRCYVAVATGHTRFRHLKEFWKKATQRELEQYWKQTRKGLDYSINLLRTNIGIESSEWIPSLSALVPLCVYLAAKDKPISDQETNDLLFWFYSASIWGRYSGSTETKLDEDLAAMRESGVAGLIRNCRKEVSDFRVDEPELVGTYQRSPFLPLLFAIVRKRKEARDWFHGVELRATNVGPKHQIELHHIFPRSLLRKQEKFETWEIDDLANIAFLSQDANRKVRNLEPIEYIHKFDIERKRLEAQFVPTDENLWRVENFRNFLTERRRLIARAMNDYLREIGGPYVET